MPDPKPTAVQIEKAQEFNDRWQQSDWGEAECVVEVAALLRAEGAKERERAVEVFVLAGKMRDVAATANNGHCICGKLLSHAAGCRVAAFDNGLVHYWEAR